MHVDILPILDDNYAYVIQSGDQVGIIDPGESKPIIAFLEEHDLKLDWVINTHKHWDHVNGNKKLIETYNAKWAAPLECESPDVVLKGGDDFAFGDVTFQILETPGHTLGHIVLFDPTYRILFAGDTLFAMGCGRVFEGTMEDMYKSLQTIKSLPPETAIYCGHEYTATNARFSRHVMPDNMAIFERAKDIEGEACTMPTPLAQELSTNPFLMANTLEEFIKLRDSRNNF